MPVESVYPDLEPLLPRVRKPIQYVGGEVGSVVKDWDDADVRWALCYPDAYEIGLPNQGIQILYEVLNERDGVLADGEQAVLAITEIIREGKRAGQPGGRDGLLVKLSPVVYVPRFYDVEYRADGQIARVAPNRPGIPPTVSKHTLMDLDAWPYPRKPIVPVAETVHERFSVEIFRGCTRGCP